MYVHQYPDRRIHNFRALKSIYIYIYVYELHKGRPSPDFGALKLCSVSSGYPYYKWRPKGMAFHLYIYPVRPVC